MALITTGCRDVLEMQKELFAAQVQLHLVIAVSYNHIVFFAHCRVSSAAPPWSVDQAGCWRQGKNAFPGEICPAKWEPGPHRPAIYFSYLFRRPAPFCHCVSLRHTLPPHPPFFPIRVISLQVTQEICRPEKSALSYLLEPRLRPVLCRFSCALFHNSELPGSV